MLRLHTAGESSTLPLLELVRLEEPQGGRPNRLLMASVLIDTFGTGAFMSLAVLFLIRIQGYDPGTAGTFVSLAFLASFLSMNWCARVVVAAGPRRTLLLCCGVSAVGFALYFFAVNPALAFVAAAIIATADRLYAAAWPTLLSDRHGGGDMSQVFATVTALKTLVLGLGALSSSVLLGAFGDNGLRFALWLNVASYISSAIVLALDKPTEGELIKRLPERTSAVLWALTDRPFLRLLTSQTLLSICWIIPTSIFPVYIASRLDLDLSVVTLVLVARYLTIMIFQISLTRVVTHYRRSRITLICVALALLVVALCTILPTLPQPVQIAAIFGCTILLATTEIVAKPTAMAAAVRIAPHTSLPAYMAAFQLTWTLAYAVAPALAGLSAAAPAALWTIIGVSLTAALFVEARSSQA